MSDIVIFEGDARPVEVRLEGETLWLTLQQIADLFGRDKSVVSRHLLYFVIKNHPFSDGNKRSGSFLFLLYLRQEGMRLTLNEQAADRRE